AFILHAADRLLRRAASIGRGRGAPPDRVEIGTLLGGHGGQRHRVGAPAGALRRKRQRRRLHRLGGRFFFRQVRSRRGLVAASGDLREAWFFPRRHPFVIEDLI